MERTPVNIISNISRALLMAQPYSRDCHLQKNIWDQKGLLIIILEQRTNSSYANSWNYVTHTFFFCVKTVWGLCMIGDCLVKCIFCFKLKYWLKTCAFKLNHTYVVINTELYEKISEMKTWKQNISFYFIYIDVICCEW